MGLEFTIFPDDILVTLRETQNIENCATEGVESGVGTERVSRNLTFVQRFLLSVFCFITLAYFKVPQYLIRYIRRFSRLARFLKRKIGLLMPWDTLQLAGLAREIANLKGRLSCLWNSERASRERIRQGGNPTSDLLNTPIRAGSTPSPVHLLQQLQIGFVVLAGVFVGCSISVGSLCLGIWIGRSL